MIKSEFGKVQLSVPSTEKYGTDLQQAELFADMVSIIVAMDIKLGTEATISILETAIKTVYGESEENE